MKLIQFLKQLLRKEDQFYTNKTYKLLADCESTIREIDQFGEASVNTF